MDNGPSDLLGWRVYDIPTIKKMAGKAGPTGYAEYGGLRVAKAKTQSRLMRENRLRVKIDVSVKSSERP